MTEMSAEHYVQMGLGADYFKPHELAERIKTLMGNALASYERGSRPVVSALEVGLLLHAMLARIEALEARPSTTEPAP